jgi:hypothetical protein
VSFDRGRFVGGFPGDRRGRLQSQRRRLQLTVGNGPVDRRGFLQAHRFTYRNCQPKTIRSGPAVGCECGRVVRL